MDVPLYFYEAYKGLDRLSPGSSEVTMSAIKKLGIDRLGNLNILDIACGVGSSTILLADYFENSTVEAFDLFRHYINVLDEKIDENSLQDRVFTYVMDMKDPDFANEEFDIIFCEASCEVIGFKKALQDWKRLLKPDGFMVISDLTWISKPSSSSVKFWKNIYSEVDSVENKITQIEKEGYDFIDCVTVPKDCWIDYYDKLEENLNSIKSDSSAKDFVKQLKKEINHYRKNSDDYSYVFYIMKK